jgi:hypothetical protein
MAQRVHSHRDILRVLQRASPQLRKAILKELEPSVVSTICEICHNVLNGAVPLTPRTKTKLSKHKTILRRLSQRGEGIKSKHKFLRLRGGAVLPLLLSIILAALSKKA